jgi:hypothetical protein
VHAVNKIEKKLAHDVSWNVVWPDELRPRKFEVVTREAFDAIQNVRDEERQKEQEELRKGSDNGSCVTCQPAAHKAATKIGVLLLY